MEEVIWREFSLTVFSSFIKHHSFLVSICYKVEIIYLFAFTWSRKE